MGHFKGNYYFTNNSSLIINGTLTANGTSSNHITFDFVSRTGNGLVLNHNSTLMYCDIKNGNNGISGNNINSSTTIANCTFQNNSSSGFYLYNSSPEISYCTFSGNSKGIYCNYYSSPYIWYCTIYGNSSYGVYCFMGIFMREKFLIDYKLVLLFLFYFTPIIAYSQTYIIEGRVIVSDEPVKLASVTFIDQNDTTKKFLTLTDTAGDYQINIITAIESKSSIHNNFELEQSYPNPFTAQQNEQEISTNLTFDSPLSFPYINFLYKDNYKTLSSFFINKNTKSTSIFHTKRLKVGLLPIYNNFKLKLLNHKRIHPIYNLFTFTFISLPLRC